MLLFLFLMMIFFDLMLEYYFHQLIQFPLQKVHLILVVKLMHPLIQLF